MQESFILKTEYAKQLEFLNMEQRGVLLTAIFNYQTAAPLPEMDSVTAILFSVIRVDLDKNAEKYKKTCERNAANISKRWGTNNTSGKSGIPKNTKNTSGKSGIPKNTKNTDNDYDYDYDYDYDNNIKNKKESIREKEPLFFNTEQDNQRTLKANKREFIPPTLEEVQAYAKERGFEHMAKSFYDYFTAGEWYDGNGNPVKRWKQKFITWEQHNSNTEQKQKPVIKPVAVEIWQGD